MRGAVMLSLQYLNLSIGECCDLRIKFTDRLRLLIMRVRYGVTKGCASMLSGVTDDSEFPMESIALATVTE